MPVASIELITQTEYARRRGCSEAAVRRAITDGRITTVDGRIDPVAADAQWERNTRPRAGSAPASSRPPAAEADAKPRDDSNGYWVAKSRREQAEAELSELKLAEQMGQLVRAADIQSAYSRRAAALRESLLQIPSRLSAQLAAESDQARCHDLLQAELHTVLAQLAEA